MMSFGDAVGWTIFLISMTGMVFFLILGKAAKNSTVSSTGRKVGDLAVKTGGRWLTEQILKKLK